MSLAQIEYFVAVAEAGTLGRAAERLHISQPPLTRQLKSLELELGVQLFERTARGMSLLPAGSVFLTHARRVLAEVQAAVAATRMNGNVLPQADAASPDEGLSCSRRGSFRSR